MPKIYPCSEYAGHSSDFFHVQLAKLKSSRKVVPVVTRQGALVRGVFPSAKTLLNTRFQSKNERNMIRIFEVSSVVKKIVTHPAVLNLSDQTLLFYTPDAVLEFQTGAVLLEVKSSFFLREKKTRDRLMQITSKLNVNQIGLLFFMDDDVDASLANEIDDLLYFRPAFGKKRNGIDVTKWDPFGTLSKNESLEARWRAAQGECDALIDRLMRRDPGELLAS